MDSASGFYPEGCGFESHPRWFCCPAQPLPPVLSQYARVFHENPSLLVAVVVVVVVDEEEEERRGNARRRCCVRRWFSGRMLACHAGGPGSIPGRRNFYHLLNT